MFYQKLKNMRREQILYVYGLVCCTLIVSILIHMLCLQEFKYKRFLDEVGEKRTFFKNGRPLKNFLLPFGSGASECPGRLFAMNELKQFLVLVLWQYEMHLSETDTPPSPDCTRAGLGILPPVQDVIFRYRMRVKDKSLHNDDV